MPRITTLNKSPLTENRDFCWRFKMLKVTIFYRVIPELYDFWHLIHRLFVKGSMSKIFVKSKRKAEPVM